MPRQIRVVITQVYTYVPDFTDIEYSENGVTTIEEALELDRKDFTSGRAQMHDMVAVDPVTTSEWSIIDE